MIFSKLLEGLPLSAAAAEPLPGTDSPFEETLELAGDTTTEGAPADETAAVEGTAAAAATTVAADAAEVRFVKLLSFEE